MTDYVVSETQYIAFTTRAFASGIPTVLAGVPVVSAYEDAGLTQITAGITLGVDHDSVVGLNMLTIVATGANGYEAGKSYNLVVTTGTVGGVSVVGEVVGQFTLGRSAAAVDLANATDGLSALKTLIDTAQADLDTITGSDGVTLATAQALYAPNVVVPDAAGVVPTAIENADALLNRDMSTGTDSGSASVRTVRQALRFLRNKWSIAGTTLTVTKEDDTAASWTAIVSTDAAADPVIGSDPA